MPRRKQIPPRFDEPARRGQVVCSTSECGRGVWWTGRGQRPSLCRVHGKPSRAKSEASLRPLMESEPSSSATRSRRRAAEREARMLSGREEYAAMRLAVGLGVYPDDPRRAAQYAQVMVGEGDTARVPTDDELEDLMRRAGDEVFDDLKQANDRGVSMVLRRFLAQASIDMLEKLPELQGKELAFAVSVTQKTIEALGGRRVQYPAITVHFGEVESDVEDDAA